MGMMFNHIKESNMIENVRDPREIDQSLKAWTYLIGQAKLDKEIVLETHKLIMKNLLPDRLKGTYRTVGITVSGRICPPPLDIGDLMVEWLSRMEFPLDHDPVNMHVAYEKIHPFIDGNGRSGRMLYWWHEIQLGKKPTLIEYNNRWEYYKWFE